MNRYEVTRHDGATDTTSVVDSADTYGQAAQRRLDAKTDAREARPGNSDTYGVRERSS